MRSLVLFSCLMLTTPLGAHVQAAELAPLTSVELHELCLTYIDAPESDEGQACAAYVRGFIEGSDRVVLRSDEPAQAQGESFSERAWRTRLGIPRPDPRYCLEKTVSLQEFISQLLAQAERKPPEQDVSAQELLYATLSRFHRCSR
jgi:Rap1a immunity proteins